MEDYAEEFTGEGSLDVNIVIKEEGASFEDKELETEMVSVRR